MTNKNENTKQDDEFYRFIYDAIFKGASRAFERAAYEFVLKCLRSLLTNSNTRFVIYSTSRASVKAVGGIISSASTSVLIGGALFVIAGGVCYIIVRDENARKEDMERLADKMSGYANHVAKSFSDGWEYLTNNLSDVEKNELKTAGMVGAAAAGAGATVVAGAFATAKLAGLSAVTHSSGAVILTAASGKFIAGTLGTVAAGVLAAPVTATVGIASGIGLVGTGTYYLYKRFTNKDTAEDNQTITSDRKEIADEENKNPKQGKAILSDAGDSLKKSTSRGAVRAIEKFSEEQTKGILDNVSGVISRAISKRKK